MKKILIILGGLVVLVIVAAIAAPFFIPTDTLTAKLIAAVKQSTGRDLKIAGPVKLSLLPQLEVEASGVSFANAPGAHDPDMMQLKKLEVQLRVLPLLHGGVELGRFVLDEPQISLEVDKNGRGNWVFAGPTAARSPPPAAPAAPPASAGASGGANALAELRLDDLRLDNGKVSYRDDRTGKTEEISAIDMKSRCPISTPRSRARDRRCGTSRSSPSASPSRSRAPS